MKKNRNSSQQENTEDALKFTVQHLIDTWTQLSNCIAQHPDKLIANQTHYWQAYTQLYQDPVNPSKHTPADKRFNEKDWQDNLAHHFIKQFYLLLSEQLNNLIEQITQETDKKVANKLKFYTRQWTDAVSPSNFAYLNPVILSKTLETNGINLMTGMQHFLADLKRGEGQLNIKNTDLEKFKLGENIACTPGKVIYQNALMQLIQYTPTTKKTYQYPLLITPPWINKYYILDLQAENSLVKWLVDQGFTVFMISWVNPDHTHQNKQFVDYMRLGPLTALKIIQQTTQISSINLLGYCIGGTLLACTLAYLTKKNSRCKINSATFLTTLLDFSEPGELGVFIDDNQLNALEKQMREKGYLDGRVMSTVFNALRANDLVWSAFVNHYLKGEQPKPFDLLYWNADPTNIPHRVHRYYLRNMYFNNHLIQSNKLKLAGVPIDLTTIKVPGYFLATQDDHIVPWQSAYKSHQHYGGPAKFVLSMSGHVAGVVNPPHKNKYGYWTHSKSCKDPDKYLAAANFNNGSWWNHWLIWLKKYAGKMQAIESSNHKKSAILEEAPGSYVKTRL